MPKRTPALVERLRKRLEGQAVSPFESLIERKVAAAHDILFFGAGRGLYERDWRGPGRKIIGVDVGRAILRNPALDEAHLYDGMRLPFPDRSFDLAIARWVIEHLPDPRSSFAELFRVLRPNGSFIFITSNRWYYPFLIATVIPNRWHPRILKWMGMREEQDTFPTYYRANTRRTIVRMLELSGFINELLELELSGADYLAFSTITYLAGICYERLVNSSPLFAGGRQAIVGSFLRPPDWTRA